MICLKEYNENDVPLVSVCIPAYNCEKFIRDTILNILDQTYKNLEIIIVDDSSSDNTYQIASTLKSDVVKVFKQKNSGAAIARNTAFYYSSGEYIQFMDADDYLSPHKIEKQVVALKGKDEKVAVCNYVNFRDENDYMKLKSESDQAEYIYSTNDPSELLINLLGGNGECNFIQTNCWLLPRKLVSKVGGWRNYRSVDDDGEFFTRLLLAASGVIYVKDVLVYYRRTADARALSNSTEYSLLKNLLLTIDLKYAYLVKYVSGIKLKKAFAAQYLHFAVNQYPQQKLLSALAYRKYQRLNCESQLPVLGGRTIELIKKFFGWRFTRSLKYYLGR